MQRAKESGKAKENAAKSDGQFSMVGVTADGIEVYETFADVKKLPWKKKKKLFASLMKNEYRDRTARFERNGHIYYAKFSDVDIKKTIRGDNTSDSSGYDAKINVGADGGIFDLIENSTYFDSQPEIGKSGKAHKDVVQWDYFIKTVQIDGKTFEILASIRKTPKQFTHMILNCLK